MSYRFKHWLDEHITKLRRAPANQQGGVEREQPKLSRPLLLSESEVFVRVVQSVRSVPHQGTVGWFLAVGMERAAVCVCVSAGPVGWRGAPRNSWGQRTPRGLAGARCLRDCSSKSSRRAIQ